MLNIRRIMMTSETNQAEEIKGLIRDIRTELSESGRVEVTFNDVALLLTSEKKGRTRITQIQAETHGTDELFLKLYPEGIGSQFGKMFGAQDIEVGESRFDDTFMIKASNESLARLWLDFDIRKSIAHAHPEEGDFLVELKDETIMIRWGGEVSTPHLIEAIKAVTAISRRGHDLFEQCKSLAESLEGSLESDSDYWTSHGSVGITVEHGNHEILVDHEMIAFESKFPEIHTRIRAGLGVIKPGTLAMCRPNAQKRMEPLVEGELVEQSFRDKDFSFNFWCGRLRKWPGDVSKMIRGKFLRTVLDALPTAVLIEPEGITFWFDSFLTETKTFHRTFDSIEILDVIDDSPRSPRVYYKEEKGSIKPKTYTIKKKFEKKETVASPTSLIETFRRLPDSITEGWDKSSGLDGIVTSIDNHRIRIYETWTVEGERQTHIVSETYGAIGLFLKVFQGDLDFVSEALGAQDIEIGDKSFDSKYVIKAKDVGYAKLWLSDHIRSLMNEIGSPIYTGYVFQVSRGKVSIHKSGSERDPKRLENLIRVNFALATRVKTVTQELYSLASEIGGNVIGAEKEWSPDSGITFTIGQVDSLITVGQNRTDKLAKKPELMTWIHRERQTPGDRYVVCKKDRLRRAKKLVDTKLTEIDPHDPHFHFLFWAGGDDTDALSNRFNKRTRGQMVLLEPEALIADERELTIWIQGCVNDIERMNLVLKLLDSIGEGTEISGSTGPYR